MKLILTGKALPEYEEKNIEIGGKPMLRILGPMQLQTGEMLPVTVWGDTKCGNWKEFAKNGEEFSIVVELFAKSQTYTNHEGESVTVPFIQMKLYSYLNMPKRGTAYNSFVAGSTNLIPPPPPKADPHQSFYFAPPPQKKKDIEDTDPTGSFRCFTEEEKERLQKPMVYSKKVTEKVKPWPTNNGIEQHETWGQVF